MLEYQFVHKSKLDRLSSLVQVSSAIPLDRLEFVRKVILGKIDYSNQKSDAFISQWMNDRKRLIAEIFRDLIDEMEKEATECNDADEEHTKVTHNMTFGTDTLSTEREAYSKS